MKLLILSLIVLFFSTAGFSQSKDSLIQTRRGFFGDKYYQNGTKLSMSELTELLKSNEEAHKYIQSARSGKSLYYVLRITGGLLLLYSSNPLSAYTDPKGVLVVAGAAMTVTSIFFYYKSKNNAQKAIDLYNYGFRKTSFRQRELRFGIQGNGLGLSVSL